MNAPPFLSSAILATGALLAALPLVSCKSNRKTGGGSPPPEAGPQIVFLIPKEGIAVDRDYNQQVFIPIQNKGPGSASLRIQSGSFEDLPSGFVGRGTPDWEVPDTRLTIPAGEIWEAPLLVHASRARQDEYTLTLEAWHDGQTAPTASGTLKVTIATPELALETAWIEAANPVDEARLRRTLRIRNVGASIPNLTMRFEVDGQPDTGRLFINPVVEETVLPKNDTIEVMIGPHLFPSFTGLSGDLVLSGLNQEQRVPFHSTLPEGKSVFVTLSHTTSRSSNGGSRCTNSPGATYNTPPTNGTPDHWSGGEGGSGASSGGGRGPLILSDSPGADDGDSPPDEEDDGWSLFGYDANAPAGDTAQPHDDPPADPAAPTPPVADPDPGETDGESEADDGTFDHMDANSEEVVGGFIPPASTGTSPPNLGEEPMPDGPDLRPNEVPRALGRADAARSDETPAATPKESATHADDQGRRTHLTRRRSEDGAEFLNFGFGIQPGVRKMAPVRLNYPISQPQLGPNPRPDAPALATYLKRGDDDKMVVETLDPETGRKTDLSDPTKNADTPVSIKIGDKVETLFRENGILKRVSLDGELAAQPNEQWPFGEATGPLLAAVPMPDGTLALLTREAGGTIAFRRPDSVSNFPATDGTLVYQGGKLHLALRSDDGTVKVIDPTAESTSDTDTILSGTGYGPPALVKTRDGGLRLYVHKPVTNPDHATGTTLGGNFAADFKDGTWSAPHRIYLPDSPVAAAAVSVEFTPPFAKAHYKKMNTDISFNGHPLATLREMVPAGRYLMTVPTSALHYTTAATRANRRSNQVVINASGIGPGSYHLTDRCVVYARHQWTQGCFVTATADQAERLASQNSGDLSHNAHDIVLATNGAQLPRDVRPGQKTTVTIAVFNAGDQESPALPLTATSEGNPAGTGTIKPLQPFRGASVKLDITIPATWRPGTSLRLTVAAPDDDDADPESNLLHLFLLKELELNLAGPTAPVRVSIESIPAESITEIELPAEGDRFEVPLQTGRVWFRSQVPPSGDLQLEVLGTGAALVDRIDLFDHEGKPLRPEQGLTPVPGSTLYVRLGLPPHATVPADTRLRAWWE